MSFGGAARVGVGSSVPLGGRAAARDIAHLKYTLFVLLLLLIPLNSLHLYYLLTLVVIVGFTLGTPQVWNRPAAMFLILTLFIFAGALLRTIALPDRNPRDYIEAARFVPLILIYTSMYRWRGMRLEHLVDAAFVYLIINGFVSIMQFLQLDPFGFNSLVARAYASGHHVDRALLISRRALGLSPGPGQHGAIAFVLGTMMLYGAFRLRGRRSLLSGVGTLIAFGCILLSQSQTAFVVSVAVFTGMVCYHLLLGDRRSRVVSVVSISLAVAAGGVIITLISVQLRYLFTLFTLGFGRSSYLVREEKWQSLLASAWDAPSWAPLGWGKDYFGPLSGAMDSELVYIYCVYGVVVFGAFLFFLSRFMTTSLVQMLTGRVIAGHSVLLFFLFLGGLVFAWPSAFFTSPNILLLLSLIHVNSWWTANSVPFLVNPGRKPGQPASLPPTSLGTA